MDGSAYERVFGNLFKLSLTIEGQDWGDNKSVNEKTDDVESHHCSEIPGAGVEPMWGRAR